MNTYTIENAELTQETGTIKASSGNLKASAADYSPFFKKYPHYAVNSREVKKWFRDNQMRFVSQDGNSVITVKNNSITAKTQNGEPDIAAMLDLAQANGWKSIKLPKVLGRGSKEFRHAIWLEASLRGLEVQGYKPDKLERQALAAAIAKEQDKPLEIVPNGKGSLPENTTDQMLMNKTLSQEDAHKKVMSVLSEFVPMDSPAYNDVEQVVEKHLANIYTANKSMKGSQLPQVKDTLTNKMPQVRQDFHKAAAAEQQKTQTANLQQNRQQNTQQQQNRSERTL